MRKVVYLFLILVISLPLTADNIDRSQVATFSIAAADPEAGEVGVAVASHFFTVGNVVPWADAKIGAVATQAYANTSYGWRGLDLMGMGLSPEEAIDVLTRQDERASRRQVGMVDIFGNSSTFTGDSCSAWAGGLTGPNYAIQGIFWRARRS